MKLAFLDRIDWDYDAGTPYERALGGTQSAVAYLTVALAAGGHEVTLYSSTTKPRVYEGVQCCSNRGVAPEKLASHDAFIVVNGPAEISVGLRRQLPARCPLILWTGLATDQQAMFALQEPPVRAAWDVIVCVSQWHAATMQQAYGLDPRKVMVMRNAIGPAFVNLFPDAAALVKAKQSERVLAYTSTPYRGLDVLLAVFPPVNRRDERARLRVYSSMKIYYQDEANDEFAHLYRQCRLTPGVEYVGALPQPALAESLKSAMILAYPSTFAETSCIAVMEAMAAGLLVVSSDLGALRETTGGMAMLTRNPRAAGDSARFAGEHVESLIAAMGERERDPRRFWSARWEQVRKVTTHCTWPVRAGEWEKFLLGRAGASGAK